MRLQSLWLKEYGVLRDIRVDFANASTTPGASLQFVAGINGSGKSTLLRAIADIFDQLHRYEQVSFPFEVTYQLGPRQTNQVVRLDGRRPGQPPRMWTGGSGPVNYSRGLLPDQVVTFTTGRETDWLDLGRRDPSGARLHARTPDQPAWEPLARELPANLAEPYRRQPGQSGPSQAWLVRSDRLPLVLLCGWLAEKASRGTHLERVFKAAKIQSLAGFSLRLRTTRGPQAGEMTRLIERLSPLAKSRIDQGPDTQLIFDLESLSPDQCHQILEVEKGDLGLYRLLSKLSDPPGPQETAALQEISLFLHRTEEQQPSQRLMLHLFDWLSDGEKDFLGRMALFAMLAGTEALILIDEPEVHFNDYWKRFIVHLLEHSLNNSHSHVLVATHSSITLSDVQRQQILLLRRSGVNTGEVRPPAIQTFGANPGDIMMYVFDAPYPTGDHSEQTIMTAIHNNDRAALERMLNYVAPGYWNYTIRKFLNGPEVPHDPPDIPSQEG